MALITKHEACLPYKRLPTSQSTASHRSKSRQRDCPFIIPTCPGCCPLTKIPPDESLRAQHELIFWSTMASLSNSGIRSPKLNWDQLKTTFVTTYWSTGVLSSARAFLHVFQWLSPQSHAMNASRDALCLIHLGARYKDQRLLLEGRTRHLAALQCMQEEVQRPNAANDDCILGAAYTLGHCEVYTVISENGGGWLGHVGGFERILKLRGPGSIQSPVAHALLHNIRQVSIMESFLKRRASLLAAEPWIDAASGNDSIAVRVGNLALKVGVLVQEADVLLAEKVTEEEYLLALLNEMVSLERDLQM